MPIAHEQLESLLRAAFPGAAFDIIDTRGDSNHYAVEVVYDGFIGQSRLERQRRVYGALKGKMDGPSGDLHALSISALTPDEKGKQA